MAKLIKKYSKIALIIGLSVTLMALHFSNPSAQAAQLANREVKISDSRPSQTDVYYDFEGDGTAATLIECILIEFCTNTELNNCSAVGSDMTVNGVSTTATTTGFDWDSSGLNATNWEILSTTSNSVLASTTAIDTDNMGTNGSFVIGGMTNPNSASVYYAHIRTYSTSTCSGTFEDDVAVDYGVVAFAAIGGVTVTATVAESLSVAVNASTCTSLITGGTATSSATTSIGFATVNSDTFYNSCQRIDVGTNGGSGFTATVRKTQKLTSGANTIADGDYAFPNHGCDNSCSSSTVGTWGTASNNGFAYCMRDETSNVAAIADTEWATEYCGGGSQGFALIDDNEEAEAGAIMQSSGATSTQQAYIGYRLSVDAVQPAGEYTTTIIYVVTPNY